MVLVYKVTLYVDSLACQLLLHSLHLDMYDPPSCWAVIPSSTSSSVIYAAYGDRVYMIDNITCKEKVCAVYVYGKVSITTSCIGCYRREFMILRSELLI